MRGGASVSDHTGRVSGPLSEVRYCYRHADRETALSCSECGRPICVDCMTVAPVGLRCPDHGGGGSRARGATQRFVRRARYQARGGTAVVTRILVALNVAVYLFGVAQGAGINEPGGLVYGKLWLDGPQVAGGGWWRLLTAAFLQANIVHLASNMLALWWLGSPLELALGRVRYLLLYLASGLAGSAGALIVTPNAVTLGASGAIFGLLGAGLILERRATGTLAGSYLTLIVINLAFTVVVPNISIGGHLGGLIAGILGTLLIVGAGRVRRAFDPAPVGLVVIGALSVAAAYLKVHGLV